MLISRRQVLIGASAASALVTATAPAEPAAAATVAAMTDQWGVVLRGATTTINSIDFPRTFDAAELKNARTWVEQNLQIARALAARGERYVFTLWWERNPAVRAPKSDVALPLEAARELLGHDLQAALLSEDKGTDLTYSWQAAGAIGKAVHDSGNDHAN